MKHPKRWSNHPIVAILGFHQIGEPSARNSSHPFYLPEATFARHLGYLQKNGWQVIDAAAFVRGLSDPATLPPRSALLTFDDGHRSFRQIALPWLQRFGYPAVLFVPTDLIGGRSNFGDEGEPEQPICDWDDLRYLATQEISIQSHSVSHRPFSVLLRAQRAAELLQSKAVLENVLGNSVDMFAYPYGDQGKNPEEMPTLLKETGYRAACLFGGGPVRLPDADCFRLARVPIGPHIHLPGALLVNRLHRGLRRRVHRSWLKVRTGQELPPW